MMRCALLFMAMLIVGCSTQHFERRAFIGCCRLLYYEEWEQCGASGVKVPRTYGEGRQTAAL